MQMKLNRLLNPAQPQINYPKIFSDLALLEVGAYPLQSLQPWWKVWRRHNEGWLHVSTNTLGEVHLVLTPFEKFHTPFLMRRVFKFNRLGQFVAYYVGRGPDPQLAWLGTLHDPEAFEVAAQRAAWIWRHLDHQGIFDSNR